VSQGIGLSLGLGLEGLVSFDITGTKCLKSDLAIRVQMMMPHSPIIGRPGKTVVYSKRFTRGQHRSGDPSPDDAGVSRRSGRVPVPAAARVSSCVIRSRPILPKMPLPWGIRAPWFLGPSRHPSLYPRPQVDRISRFCTCTALRRLSVYILYWARICFPRKKCPFQWGIAAPTQYVVRWGPRTPKRHLDRFSRFR